MNESGDLGEGGEPEETETRTEKGDAKKNEETAAQLQSSNQKLIRSVLWVALLYILFQIVTAFCCGFMVLVPPLLVKILAFFLPN